MAYEAPACENANAGEVFVNFVHSVLLPSQVGQVSSLRFPFTQGQAQQGYDIAAHFEFTSKCRS